MCACGICFCILCIFDVECFENCVLFCIDVYKRQIMQCTVPYTFVLLHYSESDLYYRITNYIVIVMLYHYNFKIPKHSSMHFLDYMTKKIIFLCSRL